MSEPRISVVLPLFDEARLLEPLLDALIPHLEAIDPDFEVVCVDDGSDDETPRLLQERAARDPRLRIRTLPRNRGKGAAVREGMLAARGRLRLFLDADLSTDLAATQDVLRALEAGADLVFGSRHAPGARIARRQPAAREILGRCFRRMSKALLAPAVQDFTCGFKGFTARAAERIFPRSRIDGWAFDAEIAVIARALGLRLEEVSVVWSHVEGGKVRLLRASLSSARDLARILILRLAGRYR